MGRSCFKDVALECKARNKYTLNHENDDSVLGSHEAWQREKPIDREKTKYDL
jgi:hypothetical protein